MLGQGSWVHLDIPLPTRDLQRGRQCHLCLSDSSVGRLHDIVFKDYSHVPVEVARREAGLELGATYGGGDV